jgi:sporulation protein YlmC with PRC-barrel domain
MNPRHGVLLSAAAMMLLAAAALAETNPTRPDLDYGGTDRPGRQATVSAKPNQTRVGQAIGRDVYSRDGTKLGTIAEAWLDRDGKLAVVTLGGDGGTIPWSSLAFEGKPTPRYVVDLRPEDLKNAPKVTKDQGYRPVKGEIFGTKAVDEAGEELGNVVDLVVPFQDGTPVALVIETGPALTSKKDYAVAWSAVKGEAKDGKAMIVAVPKQELAQAPVMMTKAPEGAGGEPKTIGRNTGSGSSQEKPTLGTSTQEHVPFPADRRK